MTNTPIKKVLYIRTNIISSGVRNTGDRCLQTIKALEIMPDHVHLFIDLDPRLGVHNVIKTMKGRSARILRSEFPQLKTRLPNLWTRSYFLCTVGHVNEGTVKKYIEDQKTH